VQQGCITVTGTVYDNAKHEPDGDTHFIIKLDPQDAHYSKPSNCASLATSNRFNDVALQSSTNCNRLLVEIICHNFPFDSVHYPKAVMACVADHGSWGDIHPASNIAKK
jgi:hypothetical protein